MDVRESIVQKGGRAFIVRADIRVEEEVDRMIKFVFNKFGSIHILVNNVGDYVRKDFLDLTLVDWDYIIDVNLLTTFRMIKKVLPIMIDQRWGRIVNISSISSVKGSVKAPHYAAAKAALNALTVSLAKKFGSYNITFNCVAPGPTETDLLRKWYSEDEIREAKKRNPMRKLASPEDVANAVLLLALNNHINGQVVLVSGGDP